MEDKKTSLLIKNCKAYINGKLENKNILMINGKISKITGKLLKAKKSINAKGNIIIPGAIDCHVHFREPGLTHKGDFLTESRAAAKGGITTVLDMPNTIPATITARDLEEKRKLARKSVVNYGFHFGSTPDNLQEIKKAKNIASVKVYMDYTTGDLKIDDYNAVEKIMKSSRVTSFHAESEHARDIISLIKKKKIKNKAYFCHTSSEKELNYVKDAKLKNAFVEITPHHLFMTDKHIQELGAFAEMKPGLKSFKDQKALWNGIKKGMIDTIATDHAPHTKEEKKAANYPFGVPGVETMLPLLLDAFNNKRIELSDIIRLCCENPARIFGIKNKGFIKEGYDADLTIIDLKKRQLVNAAELLAKCGWSPFEGRMLRGWPVTTIINGNVVYNKGAVFDVKGEEIKYS
ncbi:amidohydrolase family protein [Candidatus Woesearchaeota archaeon]|nr:amidohydrolase family protein [Candidatus Woesearchaeota archaeon]